ncbi:unnamed protein product [Effrenium voratum]|uniref:EF-hand domain-containing protein n=1 Tax=Effrenium voratum TaxID=2562239 RepID=A0AA36I3Q0_9DINO|nr:unnamed protein product [Effrenium voratum]CAJ1420862.1 unnamed protein product [Effrenium voratum]
MSHDGGPELDLDALGERIRAIFDRFDKDGGGTLDRHELHQVFKTLVPKIPPLQIHDYCKHLSRGKEGPVSREEFCHWILSGGGAKIVLQALMKETSDVLATSVREVFARFDVDGDCKLGKSELWRVFKTLDGKLRLHELAVVSHELDTGGDGTVSPKEFLHWLRQGSDRAQALTRTILKETGRAREMRIRNAFQRYDVTGDGVLDIEELAGALKVLGSFSTEEIKHVRLDLDKSGDGKVSFQEFASWVKCGQGRREVLKAKAILAPSDGDGLEAAFYNFCGPGHADMNGSNFVRLCKDCGLLDEHLDAVSVDLVFSDPRIKDRSVRSIDFLQFELALEILAEKKGCRLADLRSAVLLQGCPKSLCRGGVSLCGSHHTSQDDSGVQPRRTSFTGLDDWSLSVPQKKPTRCSSQKKVAAMLRTTESPGHESWRREVDNSQLWKVFGLHTSAGRNLKKLYQPPYTPPPINARRRKSCNEHTWSSPFLMEPGRRLPKQAW